MSKDDKNFSQIETILFDGMTFANVYDLIVWFRDLGNQKDVTDSQKEQLLLIVNQLTRLVSKSE